MELYLSDSGLQYEAGDAVSIRPNNPPELVTNLLRRLKLSADDVFQARSVEGAESKVRRATGQGEAKGNYGRCSGMLWGKEEGEAEARSWEEGRREPGGERQPW